MAIIPDGNGRWAEARGLPREVGHARGGERFKEVVDACRDAGCRALTLFAFSTENWKRDPREVASIFAVIEGKLRAERAAFLRDRVRVVPVGQLHRLPSSLRALLRDIETSQAAFEEKEEEEEEKFKKAKARAKVRAATAAKRRQMNNAKEEEEKEEEEEEEEE